MSRKFLLAAAGLAGVAVALIEKLDKIETRLEHIENTMKKDRLTSKKERNWFEIAEAITNDKKWEEMAQVAFPSIRRKEFTKDFAKSFTKGVVKGLSKAAGRAAMNKITRKDK